VHHLAAALPSLPPRKAPGYLSHQVRQQRGPGLIGYRGSSDCRVLVVSHTTHHDRGSRTSTRSPDLRQQPHGHELQLPYQTLVFDDAHAAEDYVAEAWALSVGREMIQYEQLVDALGDSVEPSFVARMMAPAGPAADGREVRLIPIGAVAPR